ncbi:hypothetical protein [Catenulispora subtropica]|uniref:Thiol:disulfide interchange protein DsbD N-terminal domain-containing protein n=1 Tax=Catenulispora subtropica TaxID=450798 RepID=A0ABN2RE34_9ACTN
MKPARIQLAGGVAALVIAAGAAYVAAVATADDGGSKPSGSTQLARFSDQGVTVTIGVKDRSAAHATLVATFAPDRPGFHLYSIDLPPDGIHGVGRPISLAATKGGMLTATGPLSAETAATTLTLTGTDLTLPVYPDGPVTVDLPVTVADHGDATVLVGYAACSRSTCLPPVSGHPVVLKIT